MMFRSPAANLHVGCNRVVESLKSRQDYLASVLILSFLVVACSVLGHHSVVGEFDCCTDTINAGSSGGVLLHIGTSLSSLAVVVKAASYIRYCANCSMTNLWDIGSVVSKTVF